jgi:hypothetical protein
MVFKKFKGHECTTVGNTGKRNSMNILETNQQQCTARGGTKNNKTHKDAYDTMK